MKKQIFSGQTIFSMNQIDNKINIGTILNEFYNNTTKYNYTHFINNRWENIYLNPNYIPSVLPLLSYAVSKAITLYEEKLKPHQTFIIPHELLGYNKNEFWFNSTSKGESTRKHNHNQQALVSGVFYLQVPNNSGNLFFINGENNELEIPAKKGKIVFFPSELEHYVAENKSEDSRISISFNFYKFPLSASTMHTL